MTTSIPVIDVFSGPGGLGEGFSALGRADGKQYFKIGVSVEKEASAHCTLELRSFFRQFPYGEVPEDYYSFLKGDISREVLFGRHQDQATAAKDEAWLDALGSGAEFDARLDQRISSVIAGHDKWILIGGPPCQAFSVIGRSRNSGKKDYRLEDDARSYLYIEYLRIIAKHQPPVFVMENVKGILSSKVDGKSIFTSILADLKNPAAVFSGFENKEAFRYRIFSLVKRPEEADSSHLPEDYIVKCEQYGIPQARHRVVLLGIREDLASFPPDILKAEEQINTEAVLNGLPELRSGLSREIDSQDAWLTPETFGKPGYADYRNPSIAEAMKNLGFVQRYGVGIQTAQEELKASGNPPAEFILEGGSVLCKVYQRVVDPSQNNDQVHADGELTGQVEAPVEAPVELSATDIAILEALAKEARGRSSLLPLLGYTRPTGNYKKALEKLMMIGLIEMTIPDKPNSRLQKYRITETGRKYPW